MRSRRTNPPTHVNDTVTDSESLGAALRNARLRQQLSLRELARRTHYSHTYLSKVESGDKQLTPQLARQCDEALGTGGRLAAKVHQSTRSKIRWPRPHQLPSGPVHFAGRSAELRMLDAWDASHESASAGAPLLWVHGPAGAGKTALVLRWAAQRVHLFDDGMLFADVGGYNGAEPGRVLSKFIQGLGFEAHRIPPHLVEAADLFRSLVHGTRTLIVLDNVTDPTHVTPLLPGSSTCRVVATSRVWTADLAALHDVRQVELGPLNDDEAVTLMRSVMADRIMTTEVVTTIVAQGDRLPLTVRTAAARMLARSHTSTTAVVDDEGARP